MIGRKLRSRLESGETLLMINPNHVSTGLAARLPAAGADLIFVDCEHGSASFEDARAMAHAARGSGGGAIVRPDSHQRSLLIRYLNGGADGLMVPMVNTAEQARAIVSAVRYGVREQHPDRLIIAMIETLEATENLEEIMAVEGIDVFFVGPGDLSQSMGFPPTVPAGVFRPQPVIDKVCETLGRIRAAGKVAGTLVTTLDANLFHQAGARFIYFHSDPFVVAGISQMKSELAART